MIRPAELMSRSRKRRPGTDGEPPGGPVHGVTATLSKTAILAADRVRSTKRCARYVRHQRFDAEAPRILPPGTPPRSSPRSTTATTTSWSGWLAARPRRADGRGSGAGRVRGDAPGVAAAARHGEGAPYLRQAVVNRSRSVLRHRKVVDMHAPKPAPDEQSAEHAAHALLERSAVTSALRSLPERQREAIVLRYYGDFSEADIAKAMGISRGAVKSHTARAMAALKSILEQETSMTRRGRVRGRHDLTRGRRPRRGAAAGPVRGGQAGSSLVPTGWTRSTRGSAVARRGPGCSASCSASSTGLGTGPGAGTGRGRSSVPWLSARRERRSQRN